MSDPRAHWLKQHGRSEQSFARALQRHFSDQAERIANVVADFGTIGPDQTAAVFRAADDPEQKLAEWKAARANGDVTPNEFRRTVLNLADVAGGDEFRDSLGKSIRQP